MFKRKKQTEDSPQADGKELTVTSFLPSALFIYDSIMVPPGTKAARIETMAEDKVGGISPFPLEKTAWGYCPNLPFRKQRHLLIYCAWADAPEIEAARDKDPEHVLPGFIHLCGHASKRPVWRFLLEDECLTALHFPEKQSYPDQVVSRFIEGSGGRLSSVFELKEEMAEKLPTEEGDEIDPFLYRSVHLKALDSRIDFQIEKVNSPGQDWRTAWKTSLKAKGLLLTADVRERGIIHAIREEQAARELTSRLLWTALLVLGLLIGFQVLLQIRKVEAERLADLRERQEVIVSDVQHKENMAKTINQFLGAQIYPFDWLSVVNVPRPETIAFRTASLNKARQFSISGVATEVGLVNTYVDALKKTEQFANVELTSMNTSQREVEFNLQLTTRQGVPEIPEPPEEAPAAEGEEGNDAR